MRRRMFLIGSLLLLILILVACGSSPSASESVPSASSSSTAGVTCVFKQFVETVYEGPDKGLSLRGDLTLHMDAAGGLTGTLKQEHGPDISVVGQVNGRAINLVFDLVNHQLLFGVGTLQYPFAQCKSPAGGTFVGPKDSDLGTWGYGIGG